MSNPQEIKEKFDTLVKAYGKPILDIIDLHIMTVWAEGKGLIGPREYSQIIECGTSRLCAQTKKLYQI